jgi:hypothetical protein
MSDILHPYLREAVRRAALIPSANDRIPCSTDRFARSQSRTMAEREWEDRAPKMESYSVLVLKALGFIAAIVLTMWVWGHLAELVG